MSLSNLKSIPIMKTDIKGFSTHVGLLNDLELSNLLEEHKNFITDKTEKYKGEIIKGEGDAFWITFKSVTAAVNSGIEIQNELRESKLGSTDNSRLAIRISISLGDILVQDDDIFGEAVNLCARIESVTPHDEIYLSNSAFLSLRKKDIQTEFVGMFSFKGFKDKEKVYKINLKYRTIIHDDIFVVFTDIEKFRTIFEDVILLERSYDEINKIVQETVDKFGVSIINFMGDAFLLTCWDVDNVIKASIYIMKNWNIYLNKNNLNNHIRIGIDKGRIKIYRSLVGGNVMNNAARLEMSSKKIKTKEKNITAISKSVFNNINNKNIQKKFNKVSKDKLDEVIIKKIKGVYTLEV